MGEQDCVHGPVMVLDTSVNILDSTSVGKEKDAASFYC